MIDFLIYVIIPMLGSTFILYSIFYSMNRIGTNIMVKKMKKNLIVGGYIIVLIAVSVLVNGLINIIFIHE